MSTGTSVLSFRGRGIFDLSGVVPIDRSSIFGNPFIIGKDGSREEVIEKYRVYFYNRLANDKFFYERVLELSGKVLGCWCKPKACHGDIIVEFLERHKNEMENKNGV